MRRALDLGKETKVTMRIAILTGSEIRHEYFRRKIASNENISVVGCFCEGDEKSLERRVRANDDSSSIEIKHVEARLQSESDFFGDYIAVSADVSKPTLIPKGAINDTKIVNQIIDLNPDILVCYGSSLINSELLAKFEGRFLNVHLGLSPYYRGSGTNVWPLINEEPDMVGATFMFIDAGIDTGEIIHQIRADIFLGDGPHTIGNRLIRKMANTYADIIINFKSLVKERQPIAEGKVYLQRDFNSEACVKLYDNFKNGMIENHLSTNKSLPYIVINSGLKT